MRATKTNKVHYPFMPTHHHRHIWLTPASSSVSTSSHNVDRFVLIARTKNDSIRYVGSKFDTTGKLIVEENWHETLKFRLVRGWEKAAIVCVRMKFIVKGPEAFRPLSHVILAPTSIFHSVLCSALSESRRESWHSFYFQLQSVMLCLNCLPN